MGTATDLDDLLFGEKGVEAAFTDKLAKGPTDDDPLVGPFQVEAHYWPPNASTHTTVSEFPIGDRAGLNVQNVMSKLHADITEVVGPAPIGRMRIRIWEDKRKSYPLVKRIRTLTAPGAAQDITHQMLLRRVTQLESRDAEMFRIMSENNANAFLMAGKFAEELRQAATIRTATTAASDIGSVVAIVGLGVLLLGLPAIKRMLKLPPDATMQDVYIAAQGALMRQGGGKVGGNPTPPTPPASALTGPTEDETPPEPDGDPPPLPDGGEAPDDAYAPPAHARELAAMLQTPEGVQRLEGLAMLAQAQGADVYELLGITPPAEVA